MESISYAPLTQSESHPIYALLDPFSRSTHAVGLDRAAQLCRLSRLSDAFTLLDKFQTSFHSPTAEHAFSVEEVTLIVKATEALQKVLLEEIPAGRELYSGALAICDM